MDHMTQNLKPTRGRELHVMSLPGVWDWKSYLAPLNIGVAGLTIQDKFEEVAHSFQLVRRENIQKFAGHEKWEIESCFEE